MALGQGVIHRSLSNKCRIKWHLSCSHPSSCSCWMQLWPRAGGASTTSTDAGTSTRDVDRQLRLHAAAVLLSIRPFSSSLCHMKRQMFRVRPSVALLPPPSLFSFLHCAPAPPTYYDTKLGDKGDEVAIRRHTRGGDGSPCHRPPLSGSARDVARENVSRSLCQSFASCCPLFARVSEGKCEASNPL